MNCFDKYLSKVLFMTMLFLTAQLEAQTTYDYGDAPDAPYPTMAKNNGARHVIDQKIYLGSLIDAEKDGQPNSNATGDDKTGINDEDGVAFSTPLYRGKSATAKIAASTSGKLDAWIDFNIDGDWADKGEQIFINASLTTGNNTLTFNVPVNAVKGNTFARFRFSVQGGLDYTGTATNGEVEDYEVAIQDEPSPTRLDFGDAPDSPYPTRVNSDGARHIIDEKIYLGSEIDDESDGQPNSSASGDDNNGSDDEDGIKFTSDLIIGQTATVTVQASVNGMLNSWIDFNHDGDWKDGGEQIFHDRSLSAGNNPLSFSVPSTAQDGNTYGRFRFSLNGGLDFDGQAADGEVEDYYFAVKAPAPIEYDYGDAPAPYPTLTQSNGARHKLDQRYRLGSLVDSENDGKPDNDAQGDDQAGQDDEDGVELPRQLVAGDTAWVAVTTSADGRLRGWIDFNRDGDWNDQDEEVCHFSIKQGVSQVRIIVPEDATPGYTYTRFRYSGSAVDDYVGIADNGEVEDGYIEVVGYREYGDAPEGIMAYPDIDVMGQFPTMRWQGPAGYVSHLDGGGMYLGYEIDFEMEGNTGTAAPTGDSWDNDEGLNDPRWDVVIYTDVGLTGPAIYTLRGEAGSEYYWPYSIFRGDRGVLGVAGDLIEWDQYGLDLVYHVTPEAGAYLNVLIDWNRDGSWGGNYVWSDADGWHYVPEHVIHNFSVFAGAGADGFGRLSEFSPPVFRIPDDVHGYVWTRWTLSDLPIDEGWDGSGNFLNGETEDYLLAVNKNEFFDFGDAPQGVPVYPPSAVVGHFPTANGLEGSVGGAIWHHPGVCYLGKTVDYEWCGNAGLAFRSPWVYDADENFDNDILLDHARDAGLRGVVPYSITGSPGSETITPLIPAGEGDLPRSLGSVGQTAIWGRTLDMQVHSGSASYFNLVVDWNRDGHWLMNEWVVQNFAIPADRIPFHGLISELRPPDFILGELPGYAWARFFLTDRPAEAWYGEYMDGESEDYLLRVSEMRGLFDFGDVLSRSYGVSHADCCAVHTVEPGFHLGQLIDADDDGQPKAGAFGDDQDGADDDDGVDFPRQLIPGERVCISLKASAQGLVNGWIDLNANGRWDHPAEQIMADLQTSAGVNEFCFTVPMTAVKGVTFARLRFSDVGQQKPNGPKRFTELPDQDNMPPKGEVEDYSLLIADANAEYDFGDAPDPLYPTLEANFGAYHQIDPSLYLGHGIDADADGQPQAAAVGDDAHGLDDDDGIKFTTALNPGHAVDVIITASATGFINAWIDFNADGDWLDAGEQILQDKRVVEGENLVTINVPDAIAEEDGLFGRFRFNSAGGLNFVGPAADGEVEDYKISVLVTSIDQTEGSNVRPDQSALYSNYPNPFNPETVIRFDVASHSRVVLKMYDTLGRHIKTLSDQMYEPGKYQIILRADDLASGIYYYKISMDNFTASKKMVVLK